MLEGPEALLLLLSLLFHVGLAHLLGALVENRVLLLLVQALEVVGLHAVLGEHALLGRGVLGHEVVVEREVDLGLAGVLARIEVRLVTVALLPRQLEVSVLVRDEHVLASLGVLLLSLLQQLVVVSVQVVSVLFIVGVGFLLVLLLLHLLFNPVFLL